MNNYKQTMMQMHNEFIGEERSRRTERRLLVIGLCLSYIACLATMWYIWNAPMQAFDTFWLSFGQSRFTLIILPILVLSLCYFSLRHITGDIIGWGVKHLDERQRMVRDQAHRAAYKVIALLCLFTPLYLIIQNMLTASVNDSILGNTQMIQVPALNLYEKSVIISDLGHTTPLTLRWALQSSPLYSFTQEQTLYSARNAILNQSIYYCLFLLILALIVWTLPRAIIAWKERA